MRQREQRTAGHFPAPVGLILTARAGQGPGVLLPALVAVLLTAATPAAAAENLNRAVFEARLEATSAESAKAAATETRAASAASASPAPAGGAMPTEGIIDTAPQGTGSAATAPDLTDGVTAGMPPWKLVVVDFRDVFTAPAHWTGREWGLFSLAVAGVAGVSQADRPLQRDVLRGPSPFANRLADTFRPLGSYASFGILGGFYLGGLVGHDNKAQETALDGLVATAIAAGVITPFLKETVGRSRPSAHQGVYDFHPFSGAASFPSGETTQAFAVGSVIAAEYPHLWVEVVSYGAATLVAYARMRENGHFASDVLAGAIIGTTVGRAVVHINQRLRARVTAAPLLGPHLRGLTLATAF